MKSPDSIRVLCVDDDPRIVEGLSLHLRKDYQVLTALSGSQALERLKEVGGAAVVISDMRMPGMDGASLLKQVMQLYPDTTRILLTGEPGRDSAVSAVNTAHVFRFLLKPCTPEQLRSAVEDGVIQHRLVIAERSILKETLIGCIKALVDVLAITSPAAFGRASRVKRMAMGFAGKLDCGHFWQLEAAAMLSQVGYLSLPDELTEKLHCGEPLSPQEQTLAAGAPDVVNSLLENIPRLEPVIQILTALKWTDEQIARLGDGTIGLGTRILGLVLEYDSLTSRGITAAEAVQTIGLRSPRFGAELVEKFGAYAAGTTNTAAELRELPLSAVEPGMIIMQDVRTPRGLLFVARGFEVTGAFIERIRNFGEDLLNRPVKVLLHGKAAAAASR
ncbi:MAG TPA: response regulator [Steroidobacteraceae bacterium]|nr:response regulator [Steroidobacteraceae bacterium]